MIKWVIALGEFDISYNQNQLRRAKQWQTSSPTSHILLTLFIRLKKWFNYPWNLRKYNQQPQHGVFMLMARPTNRVVEQA
ncbi:hypothetical protein ACFX1W_027330 [Malus domestica]